jgi:hypothetical protein
VTYIGAIYRHATHIPGAPRIPGACLARPHPAQQAGQRHRDVHHPHVNPHSDRQSELGASHSTLLAGAESSGKSLGRNRGKNIKNHALKSMDDVNAKLDEAAFYIECNPTLVKSITSFAYIAKSP